MKKHKLQFRRFAGYYQDGALQPQFIQKLKNTYEDNFRGEIGVVASWFEYCEEKYGKVKQPQLGEF